MKDWQLAVKISDLRTPRLTVRGPSNIRRQEEIIMSNIRLFRTLVLIPDKILKHVELIGSIPPRVTGIG